MKLLNQIGLYTLTVLIAIGTASCTCNDDDESGPIGQSDNMNTLVTSVPVNPYLAKFGRLYPWDFVRISDGTFYIANGFERPVLKVSPNGMVREMPIRAVHLARDGKDSVYFVVATGVVKIERDGDAITAVADASVLRYWNTQISADSAGNIYLSDGFGGGTYTAKKIGLDQKITTLFSYPEASRDGIDDFRWRRAQKSNFAVDGQGNVYFGTSRSLVKVEKSRKPYSLAGNEARVLGNGNLEPPQDGVATLATFYPIDYIKIDHHGNAYVLSGDISVRKITPNGAVTTVLEPGCPINELEFNIPNIVAHGCVMGVVDGSIKERKQWLRIDSFDTDEAGNIYYLDTWANAIRKATPDGSLATVVRGELPH